MNEMTCIIGLIHNGVTYIGADSLGSNGHSKTVRKDKKVFKLQDSKNAIVGSCGSYRMCQLLMYATGLIDSRDEPNIDHKYLVTKFIPNVIRLFDDGSYGKTYGGEKEGGFFLFGYKDRLYSIQSDYQVGESSLNYEAMGSGQDFALGSLATTEGGSLTPVERIHLALKAATQFSTSVAPPFHIINTANDEIVVFKD
jgi:ATP-dependent protease HslVU (ClpYQ) peptidase subunit